MEAWRSFGWPSGSKSEPTVSSMRPSGSTDTFPEIEKWAWTRYRSSRGWPDTSVTG